MFSAMLRLSLSVCLYLIPHHRAFGYTYFRRRVGASHPKIHAHTETHPHLVSYAVITTQRHSQRYAHNAHSSHQSLRQTSPARRRTRR